MSDEKMAELWGNPDWTCEEKLDGSRYILAFSKAGKPTLTSRQVSVKNNKLVDKTDNVKGIIIPDLCLQQAGTVIDGEMIADEGFGATVSVMGASKDKAHDRLNNGVVHMNYVLYDILKFKGKNVMSKPFSERRKLLEQVIREVNFPKWKLVRTLPNDPQSFFDIVKAGGEGVMMKKLDSTYILGARSHQWIKVKKVKTYDGFIIGMNEGEGKYAGTLGALVIGQHFPDGAVKEVATISGMTDEMRTEFWNNKLSYQGTCVEFLAQEQTEERYRHPRFVRLRPDKSIVDCKFKD